MSNQKGTEEIVQGRRCRGFYREEAKPSMQKLDLLTMPWPERISWWLPSSQESSSLLERGLILSVERIIWTMANLSTGLAWANSGRWHKVEFKQLSPAYTLEQSKMLPGRKLGKQRQLNASRWRPVSHSTLLGSHFEALLGRRLCRKVPQSPWPAFPP